MRAMRNQRYRQRAGVRSVPGKRGRDEQHSMRQRPRPQFAGGASPFTEVEDKTSEAVDTPWNVVVYNDPVNLMSYVTKVFIKVLGFSLEKAEQHMMEVHKKGRSVVWSGARERAELYTQQLHAALLLASLERSL
jgi:ATP-dependent Clp protease adaptor protein ClpS